LGARETRGQVKTRIDVTPGEVDDLAVEGGSALAGSVEGPFERRQGCIKSIPRAVISLAGLCYGLRGECVNALGHGGIETEVAELVCRPAVGSAGLVGGSFGIMGDGHEIPLGIRAQRSAQVDNRRTLT